MNPPKLKFDRQIPSIEDGGFDDDDDDDNDNDSIKDGDKRSKKKEDKGMPPPGIQSGGIEPEAHFVLRATPLIAAMLKEKLELGNLEDSLSITFHEDDKRLAKVIFDGREYRGRLVDLPCILESHKTFDSKQFYKIADVSQMLIIEELDAQVKGPEVVATLASTSSSALQDDDKEAKKKSDESKSYYWKHGLTPPLRNVRKRRFRKRAAKHIIEDVEFEVQKLLEADEEAENVKTTVEYFEVEVKEAPEATGTKFGAEEEEGMRNEDLDDGEAIEMMEGLNAEERKELGLEKAEIVEDSDESESEDDDDDEDGEALKARLFGSSDSEEDVPEQKPRQSAPEEVEKMDVDDTLELS